MSRSNKVAEAIKKEVSLIIHDELKDPRLGFVTITDVELTQDLREAKIFFSVLGKEEEHKKTKLALDSALGFIRRLIGQRIRLRFVPEITFKEDRSSEYGARIEELLNQIKGMENINEPRPSINGGRVELRKEGRGEPKKGSRLHKKK
jgi:ribosome-binding factor A